MQTETPLHPSPVDETGKIHFVSIDILRAIAALAVLLYHCMTEFFPQREFFLKALVGRGNLGVILFYLLSGFVITHSLVQITKSFPVATKNYFSVFWARRFFRIYPLYLISMVVILILDGPLRGSISTGNIVSHLLGTHIFYRDYHGAINGVLWTLGIELQFYLLAPLLFLSVRNSKTCAAFLLALFSWGIGYFFSRYYLIDILGVWAAQNSPPDFWAYFMGLNQLPNVIVYFALGFVAYRNVRTPFPLGGLIVGILLSLGLPFASPFLSKHFARVGDIYAYHYCEQLLFGFCFYFILRYFTQMKPQAFSSGTFMKPLEWLGSISYGIYIWHLVLIRFFQGAIPHSSITIKVLVSLVATIVLSDFTYRYIEKPLVKFGRKYF